MIQVFSHEDTKSSRRSPISVAPLRLHKLLYHKIIILKIIIQIPSKFLATQIVHEIRPLHISPSRPTLWTNSNHTISNILELAKYTPNSTRKSSYVVKTVSYNFAQIRSPA